MSLEMFYDPVSGSPVYLANQFKDPSGTAKFATDDLSKGLCLESGTSFWLPERKLRPGEGNPSCFTMRNYPYSGIPASSNSETDQRTAAIAWVKGLTSPIYNGATVMPYSIWSTYAQLQCYFRDWSDPNTQPYSYVVGVPLSYAGSLARWMETTCIGCKIVSIRFAATKATGSQDLDSSHKIRLIPVYLENASDEDERSGLIWKWADLEAASGVTIESYGTSTINVSSLGLTVQPGKQLFFICYFPFVMPDKWRFGTPSHFFDANVQLLSVELEMP